MSELNDKLLEIKRQKDEYIIPENLKKDVTAFGITGTLESGVKLFDTEEHMQQDTTAQEGDLAIVYRNEVQNATVDSRFQTATFPDTVVLNTAITDNIDVRYRAVDSSKMFDCWGSLDSSRFMMDCHTDSSSIRIEYTSSDGITYTRTDTMGNPVDFGTEIYYERPEMWNDTIGKFIQIGGNHFEGLYEYSSNGWVLVSTQLSAIADYVYEKEFYGKNGVEVGTLTQAVSNSFADVNAEVYAKIQVQYNNMQPRILTDQDKDIDSNIRIIPSKTDGTPLLDTSNVTNMVYMFRNCSNLTTIPLLDTSNVTNMNNMFQSCSNLTSIPLLDTSNVTTMGSMFSSCSNLTTIPLLDTSSVTNMYYMFSSCSSLNNESLNNILAMCVNAVKITSNKTLKYIGLSQEQANICKTLSNYQDFVNAGWTTGY